MTCSRCLCGLFCLQLSIARGFRSSPLESLESARRGVGRAESHSRESSKAFPIIDRRRRHFLNAVKEEVNGRSSVEEVASPLGSKPDEDGATTKRPKPVDAPDTRRSSASTGGLTEVPSRQLPNNWLGEKTYILFTSVLIGLCTGTTIAIFKESVEFVRSALYGDGSSLPESFRPVLEMLPLSAIPVLGALAVGGLLRAGGDFPPGLRDTVKEVDLDSIRETGAKPPEEMLACTKLPPISERNDFVRFMKKALAATATLGTGNSLGPEGACIDKTAFDSS